LVNVHFHTLVAQGVFVADADGGRRFVPLPVPSDVEVARLLAAVRRRIVRLVARHGIDLEDPSGEEQGTDERQLDWPAYAEIQGAAVVGRVATGPRAGAPVQRLGRDRYAAEVASTGPLHAHLDGFDLHAAVAVPAGDRRRLEHLCRYVLRPPIAQERLELAPDGAVLLRLRRPWSDGTRAIRFEPSEFLEKLAAMIPKPRINLLVYHGVFAPHAHGRKDAVRRAHEGAARAATPSATCEGSRDPGNLAPAAAPAPQPVGGDPATPRPPPPAAGYVRPKYFTWASLLERTFAIDVLTCPECGGRLRLIATITDHAVIKRILTHLGLPTDAPALRPAQVAGWLPGVETPTDWITA
jgi:hypothetical protein